jgi:hypothetical protein
LFDVIELFPNVVMLIGQHYRIEITFLPVSASRSIAINETFVYKPRNLASEPPQELFRSRERSRARDLASLLRPSRPRSRPVHSTTFISQRRRWRSPITSRPARRCWRSRDGCIDWRRDRVAGRVREPWQSSSGRGRFRPNSPLCEAPFDRHRQPAQLSRGDPAAHGQVMRHLEHFPADDIAAPPSRRAFSIGLR